MTLNPSYNQKIFDKLKLIFRYSCKISAKIQPYFWWIKFSDIDIDISVTRMRLKPISYLHNTELEFAEFVTIIGNKIQLGACNSFLIPGSLPCKNFTFLFFILIYSFFLLSSHLHY